MHACGVQSLRVTGRVNNAYHLNLLVVLLIQVPSVLARLHLQQVGHVFGGGCLLSTKGKVISTLEECSKHSKQKFNILVVFTLPF